MKRPLLFIIIALNISTLFGQNRIVFPNYADGAKNFEAHYGYLHGFMVEVNDTNLVSVYSEQGAITVDENYYYRYNCKPRQTGDFYVKAVYRNNTNNFDTVTKGIHVIDLPKLKMTATKTKRKGDIIIHTIVLDSLNNDVTDQYNFCGMLKLWIENEWYNIALIDLRTISLLNVVSEFEYLSKMFNHIEKVRIETFSVYSIATDLSVGLLSTEIKL
jgi:hypothetical protein